MEINKNSIQIILYFIRRLYEVFIIIIYGQYMYSNYYLLDGLITEDRTLQHCIAIFFFSTLSHLRTVNIQYKRN